MRMELIKKKGKVVESRPTELTDMEKINKAIQVMINLNKIEMIGKEHKALIPESVKILSHNKVPLEHSKKMFTDIPCTLIAVKLNLEFTENIILSLRGVGVVTGLLI